VPGAAYHDLCFYDLRAPSVYLRYEYPSGGAFSTSPRDVAYVLSDRWREVGPVHELVLKRHGLTLDAYQALVAEAWAALGGKLP
jgi:formylmethanofuran dehydrogenase subunit A